MTSSSHVFIDIPKTLEECCLALDKITNQEEKIQIKDYYIMKNPLNHFKYERLHHMIIKDWLYLPPEKGKIGSSKRSELANLLLAHGAGSEGESDYIMACIILENYSYYLNKESVVSIENLVVDHWFNFWRQFRKDETREKFQARMDIWLRAKANRETPVFCLCF